jgi:hypothetical protein
MVPVLQLFFTVNCIGDAFKKLIINQIKQPVFFLQMQNLRHLYAAILLPANQTLRRYKMLFDIYSS